MQERPLLISSFLVHAARFHPTREIVSRLIEGGIHRTNYAELERRARRLATVLAGFGLAPGDRVGVLAWNGFRHMETWYAVSGSGLVTHTLNPRLSSDQLVYIINHASDRVIFADLTFLPLLESLLDRLPTVEAVVAMTDRDNVPVNCRIPKLFAYEDLLEQGYDNFSWPQFDDQTASSLCYTSGTTGDPKGVLYSHHSTTIHSLAVNSPDAFGISERDNVLPVVPMYHVNAWGIPYCGPICGAKLVFAGARLDGQSIYELLNDERVSITFGVPTVWLELLKYLHQSRLELPYLKRVIIGGAACPPAMIEQFEREYGVHAMPAWGMTEMSPVGTVNTLKQDMDQWSPTARLNIRVKQGRPVFGVDMKVVDDANVACSHDGRTFGRLKVRGPWTVSSYFNDDGNVILDEEGYFDTGDIATIDADGFMQITDRAKDLIKSGGEWISSIQLENLAAGHPAVAEAAVIGADHPKWGERPLLIIVAKSGTAPSKEELLKWFDGKVARWWVPDEVIFLDEIPHTGTGKILKTALREQFKSHLSSAA